MLRSMYSGITGLKANQAKLDIVGNNIANVGTTAFKAGRIKFKDTLSQSVSGASAPGNNVGGTNAMQVGLGVQIGAIDTIMSQGNLQTSGNNLDNAIDGSGFFMVARGPVPANNASGVSIDSITHTIGNTNGLQTSYTRDGSFALDASGNLLTADGLRVLGYPVQEVGNSVTSIDYSKNAVCNFVNVDAANGLKSSTDTLVPLKIPDSVHVVPTTLQRDPITPTNFVPVNMEYTGSDTPSDIKLFQLPTDTSGNQVFNQTNDLNIKVYWEQNYVDPATSSIVPCYVISANGQLAVPIQYSPVPAGVKLPSAAVAGSYLTAKTGLKVPDLVLDPTGKTLKDQILKDIVSTTPPSTAVTSLQLNFANLSKIKGNQDKNSWNLTLNADGEKKVTKFSMEKNGVLKAVLSDGRVGVLGQIAMASFKNPGGLEKNGKNLYSESANSGNSVIRSSIGTASYRSNETGFGDCVNGVIEMSNVDLAEQFTDMIVASRAFQANGKMITTGDEILQDLVGLKR